MARSEGTGSPDFDLLVVATIHVMPDNFVHYVKIPRTLEEKMMNLAWRNFARALKRAEEITAPARECLESCP